MIQGVADVSNMGGISAHTGKRQGEIGAIVQGGGRPSGRRRHWRLLPDVVLEVLDATEQKAKVEAVRCKAIDDGVPVPDIARDLWGEVGG